MIRLAGIARELTTLVGREVDLRTPADLSRYFRDRVAASAVVKYAAVATSTRAPRATSVSLHGAPLRAAPDSFDFQ
jgi:hypothetical protein